MDLTQITLEEDKKFLKELEKIDYKKLCSNLRPELQERWQKVFNYSLNSALDGDHTTYIAFESKTPCGILTFIEDSSFFLDAICAIPNKQGKKTNLVGKTLFYQIFKDANRENANSIELKAINDGPFNVIDKYSKLGFKTEQHATDEYTPMRCSKHTIKQQLKELPFEIDYEELKPERVNLINYTC